jgi:hypothetical protein
VEGPAVSLPVLTQTLNSLLVPLLLPAFIELPASGKRCRPQKSRGGVYKSYELGASGRQTMRLGKSAVIIIRGT